MPTISEQANAEALRQVRSEKPAQFTVGGHWRNGELEGGITYNRTWQNGFGLTAYAKAYWHDLPVTTLPIQPRFEGEVGVELSRKF